MLSFIGLLRYILVAPIVACDKICRLESGDVGVAQIIASINFQQ